MPASLKRSLPIAYAIKGSCSKRHNDGDRKSGFCRWASVASVLFGIFAFGITTGQALILGKFDFNDAQFGNTLQDNDNGDWLLGNWLNIANTNPGSPAALTGANVDTGIANIGDGDMPPTYVIGYNTPIANSSGMDLGIISARFSESDTFSLAVSTDGVNFTSFLNFEPELAMNTGVIREYFYVGNGPNSATLFVTPVDLSLFGIGKGMSIVAVEITAAPEGDLIRVAGMNIPEPRTMTLISLALIVLVVSARKRTDIDM